MLNEWDLKRLLTKREVIPVAITDPEQAKILYSILDDFEKHVSPIIYDVSIQFITNEYVHNTLMATRHIHIALNCQLLFKFDLLFNTFKICKTESYVLNEVADISICFSFFTCTGTWH